MEINKITVIGGGSWGCALARILGDNGISVLIYDIDETAIKEINEFIGRFFCFLHIYDFINK